MAARTVETVNVDGIDVELRLSYFTSWQGIKQTKELMEVANDPSATDVQRLGAAIPYFEGAVANLDAVLEALGGDDANVLEVITLVNKAIASVNELKNR